MKRCNIKMKKITSYQTKSRNCLVLKWGGVCISPLLSPAYIILIFLPAASFLLGILGYFIFKKVWMMVVIVFILSLIFMFIVIGAEPTFFIWVAMMTGSCFVSGSITKTIWTFAKRKY
ncbi:DUF2651 family protein [Bacillus velezensis]|uniref:DUF2651 family protein n=2 Tax=Bacillus amyloliquefaciens group TaxID=1938374 RepID=UPI00345BB845